MNVFFLLPLLLMLVIPAHAEQIIFSEGKEYEFGEIIAEYNINRNSQIVKTQGHTTTGEMFFLRVSPTFEKVMLLDTTGNWLKAELREKNAEDPQPTISDIVNETIDLHYLVEHHERVYNKENYQFFVKTFDKSIYSGTNFDTFQGKISGAKVSSIILDPNGEIKADFEGFVEDGIYEGSILVPENLWQRGWYTIDIIIEYEDKFYFEQLSFYVYGTTISNGNTTP